jgi:NAD(P)-dependent dehydrogenase (short-subunit alcohol dehydrogenase family)
METLAKLKTLRSIASWIMERAGDGTERISGIKSAPQQTSNPKRRPEEVEAAIPRMVLRAVAEPLRSEPTKGIAGGVLIVGGDREIEQRLAERLVQKGISIVGASSTTQTNGAQQGHKDSEPGAVKDFLGRLRQTGRPIGGLLYLAPLCRPSGVDAENCSAWALSAGAESIALFNLVQQLEQDLRSNNGRVVVATAMDGAFGTSDDVESEFWPGHGGVCAIAKTLNREWPEVAATVVDFDSAADTAFIADRLASEFIARGESEIGYRGGGRVTLRPCPQPIVATESRMDLNRDGVVLLTGGARGITAEIATELAERFQPKLILVGRSELPSARERPLTAGITDVRQLKVVLREQIEASGEKPTPAKIEAAFARLQQERDIRASLAAMRAAGSIVEYVAVDVNDSAAFGQAIDRVYAKYGRLDGVVHGAGITEDKLIRDKTVESFRRVLGPKVNGACTLAAKLRLDSLKFLFFFSSVSARYGNRGQADYAAANEFLNKMAQRLNRRWAARVASINWGPWAGPADGGGMVSMELAKQFAKAGVVVVSRPAGRRLFIDELLHGDKADVEVVYGGPLSIADDRTTRTEEASPVDLSAQAWPLLNARAVITRDDDGAIECQRTLDANYDLYLLDHQLDGRPVMPMAMSLELLAEVAATVDPKMNVTAVRDLRVLKGVMLQSGPEDLRLRAVPERTAHGIDVAIKADAGGDWPHPCYKATVELRPQIRPVAAPAPLSLRHPQPLSMSIDEAYEKWLFHGPLFAGIVDVQGLGENGIIATLAPSSPRRLLAEGNPGAPGHWLIDPVVVDSGLQLLILWARTYMDMTPLPSRLGCYYRNADALQSDVRCEVHIRSTRTSPSIHADLVLRDASGFVVGWLEDMEVTCSKALNRLSATRASSAGAKA